MVINKVSSAPPANVEQVEANIREANPRAIIVQADSRDHAPSDSDDDRGQARAGGGGRAHPHSRRHGHRRGVEAARQFGAEPRSSTRGPTPWANLAETYANFPHLGPILPALGYYEEQLRDLGGHHQRGPGRLVVSATPFSLGSLIKLDKPLVQVAYEMAERGEPRLSDVVRRFLGRQGLCG